MSIARSPHALALDRLQSDLDHSFEEIFNNFYGCRKVLIRLSHRWGAYCEWEETILFPVLLNASQEIRPFLEKRACIRAMLMELGEDVSDLSFAEARVSAHQLKELFRTYAAEQREVLLFARSAALPFGSVGV